MILSPKLIAYGIGSLAVVSLLFFAAYKLYDAGRDSVQARWDAEKAVQEAALAAATAETARIESEREKLAKEIDEKLKPKLEAATRDAKSLADRLRLAARSSSLSETAGPASEPDGTSRRGGQSCTFTDGVEQAIEDHFAASARDSERLNAWISFYRQLQESQN